MTHIKDVCDKVKAMVDRNIVWTADEIVFDKLEHWVSHADWILINDARKPKITDDCDGFALSSADLLIHFGVAENLIRIVFCTIPGVGGHCICCVDDPEANETWSLDNNETDVVSWATQNMTFKRSLRLSERNTVGWRHITA